MMPDDFEDILDRCLADIAAGRETIDSCQRLYAAQSGQLAVLLQIAQQVRQAPPPAPLPTGKRRALEARLLRRAGQLHSRPALRPAVPRVPLWRRRAALALASFVVVFLLLSSVVTVSAASVPGDFLYPVKRATEQVRLTLAPPQQRVELNLEFAGQRLLELRTLKARGEISKALLAEISSDTTRVLEQIPALPHPAQPALLTSLTSFEDQQLQVLEDMASSAQGDAQAAVLAALADSTTKHKEAVDLLAKAGSDNNPASVPSPTSGPASLQATLPAQSRPVVKPESTDTAGPQNTGTPPATSVSPSNSLTSTPEVEEHTVPGQARQSTPLSPPGHAKRTTPQSPPGQAKQSTPHSPPGQAKQSASESPPEKPVKTPKK